MKIHRLTKIWVNNFGVFGGRKDISKHDTKAKNHKIKDCYSWSHKQWEPLYGMELHKKYLKGKHIEKKHVPQVPGVLKLWVFTNQLKKN